MTVAKYALVVACLLVARSVMASDLPNVTVSTVPLSNPEHQTIAKSNAADWNKASQ